jgi:hypothetical protein
MLLLDIVELSCRTRHRPSVRFRDMSGTDYRRLVLTQHFQSGRLVFTSKAERVGEGKKSHSTKHRHRSVIVTSRQVHNQLSNRAIATMRYCGTYRMLDGTWLARRLSLRSTCPNGWARATIEMRLHLPGRIPDDQGNETYKKTFSQFCSPISSSGSDEAHKPTLRSAPRACMRSNT